MPGQAGVLREDKQLREKGEFERAQNVQSRLGRPRREGEGTAGHQEDRFEGPSVGAAWGRFRYDRNQLIWLVAGDCNAPNVLRLRFRLDLTADPGRIADEP